jgi:WD40 repeat protein
VIDARRRDCSFAALELQKNRADQYTLSDRAKSGTTIMWTCFKLFRCTPALFVSLLLFADGASAQERSKIEIVPSTRHSRMITSVALSPDGIYALSGGWDNTLKLWDVATARLLRTSFGHANPVWSVAFSPDGASLLSASFDKTVKLWDTATGRITRTFEGHSGSVWSATFSRDGARVLSGSSDKTLRMWDAATGQLIRTFEGHSDAVRSVVFSSDGTRVLSGSSDKTLKMWDAATGQLIRTFEGHSDEVRSVAFSLDGTRVLSGGGDKTLRIWDAATGQVVRTFEGHSDLIWSVAFSPDGDRVLSSSWDKTSKLWDAATGRLVHTLVEGNLGKNTPAGIPATFSTDGAHVLSGGFDTLTLWASATGRAIRSFEGHASSVGPVEVSPNGAYVLTGGRDGVLKLWDAQIGRPIRAFKGHTERVVAIAFSRDGAQLLSGSDDKTLRLWDTATGKLIRTFEGHSGQVWLVRFSARGNRVLSASSDPNNSSSGVTLKLWDASSGQLIHSFNKSFNEGFAMDLSPDGAQLVIGGEGGTFMFQDLTTGLVTRTFEAHKDAVKAVAFSSDGAFVISGSKDKTVKLWDAATGQLIRTFEGHEAAVDELEFAPGGGHVLSSSQNTGSWDVTQKLWETGTGQLIGTFLESSGGAKFSPDGRQLLVQSRDKTLAVWDAATGQLVRSFERHAGDVWSLKFLPGRSRVVTGGDAVRIWNQTTGELLATLLDARKEEWLTITPAGYFAAPPHGTEALSIVRGLEPYSVMQFYDHLHRPDLVEERLKGDPESKYKDAVRRINLERILDSGPAPQIELLPKRTEKTADTIKLAARLSDTGGGIGSKVIWRVNGKTQGATTAPGLGGPTDPGRYVIMTQMLTVDPSKTNEVEIIAYNGSGLLAAAPMRFPVDAWGVAIQERPRLFVLSIGVDKYLKPDWQLRYAARDAGSFAAALKAVGSAKIEGVSLFSDIQVKTLLDAEVTERNIAAEFERLSKIIKARDVFVLFLGGHGRSIAGEGWFFLPQDFNLEKGHIIEKDGIGSDKWRDWQAKIPAEKSLIILDACESGANEAFRGGDRAHETVMAQLEHATGRNTIAAAPPGKAAYEGYNGHGVLTYALLEALHRPEGGPALPITVYGLAAHVSLEVPAISQRTFGFRQQPRFTPTGDNFALGVRQTVLKNPPAPLPTAPTHITKEALKVFKDAGGRGGVVQQLDRFTLVTLVKSERGWAQIARDGKSLGYVPESKLQKAH